MKNEITATETKQLKNLLKTKLNMPNASKYFTNSVGGFSFTPSVGCRKQGKYTIIVNANGYDDTKHIQPRHEEVKNIIKEAGFNVTASPKNEFNVIFYTVTK